MIMRALVLTLVSLLLNGLALASTSTMSAEPAAVSVPTPADQIEVQIKSRAHANSSDSELKDAAGIVLAAYLSSSQDTSSSESETHSLNGSLDLSRNQDSHGIAATLTSLTIEDSSKKILAAYEQPALADLEKDAKYGLVIKVILTQDAGVAPEIRVSKVGTLPADGTPDTKYVSIKSVFPDSASVTQADDMAKVLETLRGLSSATQEYHQEVLALAKNAKSLDLAHLEMMADAVYYTEKDIERLLQAEQLLEKQTDDASKQALARVEINLNLARELSEYLDALIDVGAQKIQTIAFDDGIGLLERLSQLNGGARDAFEKVIQSNSPLSADQETKIISIAVEKRQQDVAAEVSTDFFKKYTDHSVKALLSLAANLKYGAIEPFLLGALDVVQRLEISEVAEIVGLASSNGEAIAQKSLSKVEKLTVADVVQIAKMMNYGDKDTLISVEVSKLDHITTAELASLVAASYSQGDQLAINALSKVSDLSAANAAALAKIVNYGDKDTLLAKYLDSLSSVSTGELIGLMQASYRNASALAFSALSKLSDFTPANAMNLAGQLNYGDKDTLLARFLDSAHALSTNDLLALMAAGYRSGSTLAFAAVQKLNDFSAANAVRIAGVLNYGDKDTLLKTYVDGRTAIPTGDLVALVSAAYSGGPALILNDFGKISDISVQNTITLAAHLNYGDKDTLVADFLALPVKISTQELQALASASYRGYGFVQNGLEKLHDLDTDNLITLLAVMNYGDKDVMTARALDLLKSLTPENLVRIANAGYNGKPQNIVKAVKFFASVTSTQITALAGAAGGNLDVVNAYFQKISNLSAGGIAPLLDEMNYGNKDVVVNLYLGRVATFSTSDLTILYRHSYSNGTTLILNTVQRVSDLTVQNAISLSSNLTYGNLDTYLLAAVDAVTDLTTGNLPTLASHAYNQQDAILKKGLARLSQH